MFDSKYLRQTAIKVQDEISWHANFEERRIAIPIDCIEIFTVRARKTLKVRKFLRK